MSAEPQPWTKPLFGDPADPVWNRYKYAVGFRQNQSITMSTAIRSPMHRVRKLLRHLQRHEDELEYYGLSAHDDGSDYVLVSGKALKKSPELWKLCGGTENKPLIEEKVFENKPVRVFSTHMLMPYVKNLDLATLVACLYGIHFEVLDFFDAPVPLIYNVYNYSNKWECNYLPLLNDVMRARLYFFDVEKSLTFLRDMYDFERQPDINRDIAQSMLESGEAFVEDNYGKNSPNFEELTPEQQKQVQDTRAYERVNEVKETQIKEQKEAQTTAEEHRKAADADAHQAQRQAKVETHDMDALRREKAPLNNGAGTHTPPRNTKHEDIAVKSGHNVRVPPAGGAESNTLSSEPTQADMPQKIGHSARAEPNAGSGPTRSTPSNRLSETIAHKESQLPAHSSVGTTHIHSSEPRHDVETGTSTALPSGLAREHIGQKVSHVPVHNAGGVSSAVPTSSAEYSRHMQSNTGNTIPTGTTGPSLTSEPRHAPMPAGAGITHATPTGTTSHTVPRETRKEDINVPMRAN